MPSVLNITGPAGDLPGDIGGAVLASLHGPRRPRVCARKVRPRTGTCPPYRSCGDHDAGRDPVKARKGKTAADDDDDLGDVEDILRRHGIT